MRDDFCTVLLKSQRILKHIFDTLDPQCLPCNDGWDIEHHRLHQQYQWKDIYDATRLEQDVWQYLKSLLSPLYSSCPLQYRTMQNQIFLLMVHSCPRQDGPSEQQ